MKKLFVYFYVSVFLLFAAPTLYAQVLFEEDLDGYPVGDFISDQYSTIPNQGGWYCGLSTGQPTADGIVTPESGKGNVLIVTPNGTSSAGSASISFRQTQGIIDSLWNIRTAGHNILKFEFEFSANGNFTLSGSITGKGNNYPYNGSIIAMGPQSNVIYNRIIGSFLKTDPINYQTLNLQNFNTTGFPYNTWIKLEAFIDFNTNDVYFYLPMYNIQAAGSFSHDRTPTGISFSVTVEQSAIVKLDNIKLSALQTLPTHLVSVNKFVSSKFTVFPNPVTDRVTITNSENIDIEQIEVFDSNGKKIQSQNFNNENEVQLNLGYFASGMYLLHIKTNEGTAVKKVVKK